MGLKPNEILLDFYSISMISQYISSDDNSNHRKGMLNTNVEHIQNIEI